MREKAKRAALLVGLVALAATVQPAPPTEALKIDGLRRVSLNEGRRFLKGEALGAERLDFDDSGWRALDIPHDWAIEGPFDYKHNPDAGGLPSYGVGWYRKRFDLPASGQGRFYSVDLAGFPKDRYYLYQSVWTREPMVHVLPHWNWAGREGQTIPVVVYTNCAEAELFLNGKSLGRNKRGAEPMELPVGTSVNDALQFKSKYRLMWRVPYKAGSLRAVGLENGKPVATKEVRTAGAPARITPLECPKPAPSCGLVGIDVPHDPIG